QGRLPDGVCAWDALACFGAHWPPRTATRRIDVRQFTITDTAPPRARSRAHRCPAAEWQLTRASDQCDQLHDRPCGHVLPRLADDPTLAAHAKTRRTRYDQCRSPAGLDRDTFHIPRRTRR